MWRATRPLPAASCRKQPSVLIKALHAVEVPIFVPSTGTGSSAISSRYRSAPGRNPAAPGHPNTAAPERRRATQHHNHPAPERRRPGQDHHHPAPHRPCPSAPDRHRPAQDHTRFTSAVISNTFTFVWQNLRQARGCPGNCAAGIRAKPLLRRLHRQGRSSLALQTRKQKKTSPRATEADSVRHVVGRL